MLYTILLGLLSACLLVPFGKYIRKGRGSYLAVVPASLFVYYLFKIPSVSRGGVQFESTPWVPSLGIDFGFRLDGLSLLFALLITGIGTLIFIYAGAYLKKDKFSDRFFGYLLLFMSSMLGLVLSDNIMLLFIFWELTGISSFFLIGYHNEQADSRKSAMVAFSVTALGGFFLLAGLVLMGHIVGSFSVGEILNHADIIRQSHYYPAILMLVLLGAFTKSAQFPFHFWLPDAMKAPTPVSAYLHSATMVKAGIFMLARFTPVLGGTLYWQYSLMIIGGFTMIFGAVWSLVKVDLKEVLAYSTISALGILTFLLGIGSQEAVIAASVFLLVHALYKAALFLVTGIIDHETGTRNLSRLAGLGKIMPAVAIAGALAALSSAGLPLTYGFIGKDLIYAATANASGTWSFFLTSLMVLTKSGLVAAGFLAGIKAFVGQAKEDLGQIQKPVKTLWIPPLILAGLGLIFGLFPQLAGDYLNEAAVKGILQIYVPVYLKIWHGFNAILGLSLMTLAIGTLTYFTVARRLNNGIRESREPSISAKNVFEDTFNLIIKASTWFTNFFHNGYLRSYLIKIIIFAEILLAYALYKGGWFVIDFKSMTPVSIYDIGFSLVFLGALYKTLKTSSRVTAVVSMGVIGYVMCLIYVVYSAPDLAMTQFTIDTLTVVLFVLVLYKLPPFIKVKNKRIVVRDAVVSIIFGVLLSIISLRAWQEPTNKSVSDFFANYAYTLGQGRNVVNVILVDFRGFDTMFEIVVLSVAAIGVYSLLKLRLKSSEKE